MPYAPMLPATRPVAVSITANNAPPRSHAAGATSVTNAMASAYAYGDGRVVHRWISASRQAAKTSSTSARAQGRRRTFGPVSTGCIACAIVIRRVWRLLRPAGSARDGRAHEAFPVAGGAWGSSETGQVR